MKPPSEDLRSSLLRAIQIAGSPPGAVTSATPYTGPGTPPLRSVNPTQPSCRRRPRPPASVPIQSVRAPCACPLGASDLT